MDQIRFTQPLAILHKLIFLFIDAVGCPPTESCALFEKQYV